MLVARERSETLRTVFLNDLAPYLQQPERLVFLDESGFNTAMTCGYARAPSTERATCSVVRSYSKNHTLICALSLAGPLAPLVIEGALNGEFFEWYVQNQLCPTLSPGQVVVMDNQSSHHQASIRTLIEAQECTLLYPSPYSPDCNPVETLFSRLKALLRGWKEDTVQALYDGIGRAFEAVTPKNIFGWFRHAHPSVSLR